VAEDGGFGIRPETLQRVAAEIAEVSRWACRSASSWAAATSSAASRARAPAWTASQSDYMGMLATVINALALQDALERVGVPDARA
jgi:uridylate kinase